MPSRGQRLGRLLRSARQVAHQLGSRVLVPEARTSWQQRLEERVMQTVLQATRVTNDGSYQTLRTQVSPEAPSPSSLNGASPSSAHGQTAAPASSRDTTSRDMSSETDQG
ncbi:MAG: hypothetical protein ACKO6N_20985 [Myxococcota bacterium]